MVNTMAPLKVLFKKVIIIYYYFKHLFLQYSCGSILIQLSLRFYLGYIAWIYCTIEKDWNIFFFANVLCNTHVDYKKVLCNVARERKKKLKPNAYFSDEEDISEWRLYFLKWRIILIENLFMLQRRIKMQFISLATGCTNK